jgi:hypothetical protein
MEIRRGVRQERSRAALAALALVATACGAPHSAPGSTAQGSSIPPAAGPSRSPLGFYGVNFDDAGFEQFSRVDTSPLLAALEPATIRWPGGTEADFYDWHTGENQEKPGQVPFTLDDLGAAVRATGAVPIFDLNVLEQSNRTDPTDQIAMLKAASQLGLPVRYVEIGNELYSNGPGFAQAFPDGTAYARTVSIYVQALHRAFPGVQVAADAVLSPLDEREQSWDQELLAGAVGAGAPDALIVHFYPGLYFASPAAPDVPELFSNLYSSVAELSRTLEGLGGKPVWLTEYNFRGPYQVFRQEGPNPIERDFAHELYLAALAAMLPRVRGLVLADNWTAFGDGLYGAWQNPSAPYLSPGGQAVEMVDTAAKGATSSASVLVAGAPALPGGSPGVVGQVFLHPGGSTTAVLVNLTASVASVPSGQWLAAGTRYEQVADTPLAPRPEAALPEVGVVGADGVTLPPYSVTVTGAALAAPTGS